MIPFAPGFFMHRMALLNEGPAGVPITNGDIRFEVKVSGNYPNPAGGKLISPTWAWGMPAGYVDGSPLAAQGDWHYALVNSGSEGQAPPFGGSIFGELKNFTHPNMGNPPEVLESYSFPHNEFFHVRFTWLNNYGVEFYVNNVLKMQEISGTFFNNVFVPAEVWFGFYGTVYAAPPVYQTITFRNIEVYEYGVTPARYTRKCYLPYSLGPVTIIRQSSGGTPPELFMQTSEGLVIRPAGQTSNTLMFKFN